MQYEHDWLERRGDHDRPRNGWGSTHRCTAREPVSKDARYYRRRGAFWTDPSVHCPSRTRALHALDNRRAERAHHVELQRRDQADAECAHRQRRGVRRARRAQRERLHARRQHNFDRAVPGTQKNTVPSPPPLPPAASPPPTPCSWPQHKGPVPKDAAYYRLRKDTGFRWADLAHCPADRLHLVVRPSTIAADGAAAEQIERNIERDMRAGAARREAQKRAGRAIRARSVARRQRPRSAAVERPVAAPAAAPASVVGIKDDGPRRCVFERLSRPKSAGCERKPLTGAEFRGLIAADDGLLRRVNAADCAARARAAASGGGRAQAVGSAPPAATATATGGGGGDGDGGGPLDPLAVLRRGRGRARGRARARPPVPVSRLRQQKERRRQLQSRAAGAEALERGTQQELADFDARLQQHEPRPSDRLPAPGANTFPNVRLVHEHEAMEAAAASLGLLGAAGDRPETAVAERDEGVVGGAAAGQGEAGFAHSLSVATATAVGPATELLVGLNSGLRSTVSNGAGAEFGASSADSDSRLLCGVVLAPQIVTSTSLGAAAQRASVSSSSASSATPPTG
eukprot:g487.t1